MTRTYRIIALASIALAASACADAPVAPALPPSLEVVDPAVLASTLTRDVPLAADVSVGATIGKAGGEIHVGAAGLKFVVPPGALAQRTRITVTAVAGAQVAYVFHPHGLVFKTPASFSQDLKGTSWYKLASHATVEGAYFADRSQLHGSTGEALINEFLPVAIDLSGSKVTFPVEHFSGYLVATGRKSSY